MESMKKRIGFSLALAVLAGTVLSLGQLATPTSSAEPVSADEVRVRTEGDTTWTMRVFFDPAFTGDRAAIADAMGVAQEFRRPPELTVSYATTRPWASATMPIQVQYNPDFDITQASQLNGVAEMVALLGPLQRAMSVWSAATQRLAFEYAGTTTRTGIGCDVGTDGVNLIRFGRSLPNTVLGKTCTASRTSFAGSFIFEFDIEIADDGPWATGAAATPSTAFDLDSVVLHELGHAVGLGHSAENAAVMYASITRGVQRRALTADDAAGIQALYGAPPTPSPTPIATAIPSTVSVFPNGPYIAGLNSVAVLGSGTPAAIAARIALESGKPVTVLWVWSSGVWRYYLPAAPTVNGGLSTFAGPTAAVLVVLA
ncbi:MAG: matrixin family metalloprotease [Dehalococcoidia bacterium]|nr:matrixin family metalloprotease [Dehalococcoidia bacterium]